jgi:DNA topoisomerase-1
VQLGENGEDKQVSGRTARGKAKPRRTSLPRSTDGEQITLEQALGLLALPRVIGTHPETKQPIEAGIGRFGPFVRMGTVYGSLDRDDDVLSIGINRAVDLLAKKLAGVRMLGLHPTDPEPVFVRRGRFGPYVQHRNVVANVPRGVTLDEVTLTQAVALLVEKGKTLRPRGAGVRRGRKSAPKRDGDEPGQAQVKKSHTAGTNKSPTSDKAASAGVASTSAPQLSAKRAVVRPKKPARGKKTQAKTRPAKRATR